MNENGLLFRIVVLATLGLTLILTVGIYADRIYARDAIQELLLKQTRLNEAQNFATVMAALTERDRTKLLDLAVQQLQPDLRREVNRRVLIPAVPDIPMRKYGTVE